MAKGDISNSQKQTNQLLGTERDQYNQFQSGLQPEIQNSQQQANSLYPGVVSGYNNMSVTGGYDPGQLSGLRNTGSSLLNTGGYDPTNLSALQSSYGSLQGGLDQSIVGNLSNTGGYDPNSYNELAGGYENLMSTGGISNADAAQMTTAASRASRSIYDVLSAQANRNAAITGGTQGPELSKLARQSGNTAAEATTNAAGQIAQLRQQGTEAGLSGYNNLQSSLAGSKMLGVQSQLSNQQNMLNANNAASNLASNVAGGIRSIYGQNAALESDVAGGSRAGTAGMANLYNSILGNNIAQQGLGLSGLNSQSSNTNSLLAQLSQLGQAKPGLLQSIMGPLQAAGNIFGSVFSPIKL